MVKNLPANAGEALEGRFLTTGPPGKSNPYPSYEAGK